MQSQFILLTWDAWEAFSGVYNKRTCECLREDWRDIGVDSDRALLWSWRTGGVCVQCRRDNGMPYSGAERYALARRQSCGSRRSDLRSDVHET